MEGKILNLYRLSFQEITNVHFLFSFRQRRWVLIADSDIKAVIPAKAGIQQLIKILDSVSRFVCTE
jgi:hypothetical protein